MQGNKVRVPEGHAHIDTQIAIWLIARRIESFLRVGNVCPPTRTRPAAQLRLPRE